MIFNIENTKGKQVQVYDAMGKPINIVRWYDTVTRMAEIVVPTGKSVHGDGKGMVMVVVGDGPDHKVATAQTHLAGSWIIVDGVRY
jgi:hypothetical protein